MSVEEEAFTIHDMIILQHATQTMLLETMRNQAVISDTIGSLTDTFGEMRIRGSIVERVRKCRDLGTAIIKKIDEFSTTHDGAAVFGGENAIYEGIKKIRAEESELVAEKNADVSAKFGKARREAAYTSDEGTDGEAKSKASAAKKKPKKTTTHKKPSSKAPAKVTKGAVKSFDGVQLSDAPLSSGRTKAAVKKHVVEKSTRYALKNNVVSYGLQGEDGCMIMLYDESAPFDPEDWRLGVVTAVSNVASKEKCLEDLKVFGDALGAGVAWILQAVVKNTNVVPAYFEGDWGKEVEATRTKDYVDAQAPLLGTLLKYVGRLIGVSELDDEEDGIKVMKGAVERVKHVVAGFAGTKSRKRKVPDAEEDE